MRPAPIRVLEAGCGDGLLATAIAEAHPAWTVFGVDLRTGLLDRARERAADRGVGNVRFLAADLTQALPEADFDAVAAIECLSEIPDDRAAVASMAASLAPGGIFVAHVPDRDWTPVLRGSAGTWREQVRQGYTAESLAALLAGAGLERVTVRHTYHSLAAAAQEIRDRIKERPLALRAAAYPAMVAAAALESHGVAPGPANALLAVGHQSATPLSPR